MIKNDNNYMIENVSRTKFIAGEAKDFEDLKKKVARKLKWRGIHDMENYFVSVCLKGDEIEKWGVEIKACPKDDYSNSSVENVRMTYKLPEWILLNEDFDYRTSDGSSETETYDFYTHPEIKKYDIVYCHFDNQYYIALEDMSDPWGYNSYKLSGGNVFPERGATIYGISQYYIEKVERENVPKNILEALDELIELFKSDTHDPLDCEGKTFEVHRKICEAQGVEFDDCV